MAFLWPSKLKTEPSALARLGRVLHWMFVGIALLFLAGNAEDILAPSRGSSRELALQFLLFGGGASLLIGRALRYILSGE